VLGKARVEGDGGSVGQLGVRRVRTEMLATNVVDASWIAPVPRSLPGQPPLLLDGYMPVPEPENAYHHVRLDFRVGEHNALLDDTVYARLSMGMTGFSSFGLEKLAAEGLPMRSVLRGEMFGDRQIESLVTAISEAAVPSSAFEIPAGYTEVPPPTGLARLGG
jgi:hypothetical protein